MFKKGGIGAAASAAAAAVTAASISGVGSHKSLKSVVSGSFVEMEEISGPPGIPFKFLSMPLKSDELYPGKDLKKSM